MERLEQIVARLPEARRVDIEAWGGEPTFRVGGKNFVFASPDATSISLKLPAVEAAALVATDPRAVPTGYGLGRHGWVTISLAGRLGPGRWREIDELVRTSFTMIAPRRLARRVIAEDAPPSDGR
jgi:predicted DNA-binding protein (MmcQ/YjbR family)